MSCGVDVSTYHWLPIADHAMSRAVLAHHGVMYDVA